MKAFLLFFLTTLQFINGSCQEDPCAEYSEISDLLKRSPSYVQDAMPLCDNHLTTGWYRAGFLKMPTSPPALKSCGTYYPYWLNGDHPSTNKMKEAKICKVGITNPCSQAINISVKNCSAYIVYRLSPVECCNSAYCFGTSDIPMDPSVSYYNLSWVYEAHSTVKVTRYNPSVNLICSFTPFPDESLFYDISWYVDNIEVVKGQTVTSSTLDNALLSARDMLEKNKTAGSMIQCIVGSKSTRNGFPCAAKASPLFFAGIEVLTPQLYIERGGKAVVQLQLTIPYATENLMFNDNDFGTYDLPVFVRILKNTSLVCDSKYIIHDRCEALIKGYTFKERAKYETDIWKQIYNVSMSSRNETVFAIPDGGISLQLMTGRTYGTGGSIFSNLKLPDIQVYSMEALPSSTVSITTIQAEDCETKPSSNDMSTTPITMRMANISSSTSTLQTTTAKSKINANVSKCRDTDVSVYSEEDCDLVAPTSSEKFTIPGYAFIVVVSVLVSIIVMVVVFWRCRLASNKKKKRMCDKSEEPCHENQSVTGLASSKAKHSICENENRELPEGQTIDKNEYTCITELDEIMSTQI